MRVRRGGRTVQTPREPQASAGGRPLSWGGPATLTGVKHAVRIWGDGTEPRTSLPGPHLRPNSSRIPKRGKGIAVLSLRQLHLFAETQAPPVGIGDSRDSTSLGAGPAARRL